MKFEMTQKPFQSENNFGTPKPLYRYVYKHTHKYYGCVQIITALFQKSKMQQQLRKSQRVPASLQMLY